MSVQSAKFIRFYSLFFLLMALAFSAKAQFLYFRINGTATITGYTGPGGAVVIPASINGLPVTAIWNAAFLGNPKLNSVTIDDNVNTIGFQAFQQCSGLIMVTIGKGVTNVDNNAFDSCNNLTNVTMSDTVSDLGENAFRYCTSLASIRMSEAITMIPDQAFQGCSNLTSITIGSSVTNLGNNAFENCTGLKGIYFRGNAPAVKACVFCGDSVKVYYLPGTSGWGPTFAGRPTSLWNPQAQIDAGNFGVGQNHFGFNISGTTNIPLVVEACTNLAAQLWVPLHSCTLTNGLIYFNDAQWTNYADRFYRIQSP